MMSAPVPWDAVAGQAFSGVGVFAEALVAAMLFAHGQERKPHTVPKVAGWVAFVFIQDMVLAYSGWLAIGQQSSATAFLSYRHPASYPLVTLVSALFFCSLVLVYVAILVHSLYHMGRWAAVYCATAGYALQNLASGFAETFTILVDPSRSWTSMLMGLPTLMCCAITYLIAWHFFIRRIDASGLNGHLDASTILMFLVVAFGVIGFDLILKDSMEARVPRSVMLCLRAFHALVCVFVIVAEVELVVVRQLSSEKAVTEHLLAESERQYRLSRDNIAAINARIHDIRHDVMRTIYDAGNSLDRSTAAEIVREVEVYDSPVRTGNEALDVVLTEKSLLCQSKGITLTCVADGRALGFMDAADLYLLFGSLLDGAIEAMEGLPSTNQKSISLVVKRRANVVSIHMESYRNKENSSPSAPLKPNPSEVRAVIERYEGALTITPVGTKALSVDVLIPSSSRGKG